MSGSSGSPPSLTGGRPMGKQNSGNHPKTLFVGTLRGIRANAHGWCRILLCPAVFLRPAGYVYLGGRLNETLILA